MSVAAWNVYVVEQTPQEGADETAANMRPVIRTAPIVMLLWLGACAAVAPRTATAPSVDVPAGWSVAQGPGARVVDADDGALAGWWQRFDDPLLVALVDEALRGNTDVAGAQAALRQAQALRDVAAAALWPSLLASASARHGTAGGDSTGNSFQLGLNANWAPDVFGGVRAGVDAGEAALRAGAATLGDTQLQVAAEVALDYILLRTAQARLAIAADNLAGQRETLQLTQWREQAGLVTTLESEQARAAAEQTAAALPALRTSIDQTGHALALLTGAPPAALAARLAATGVVPLALDDPVVRIPAETLRQRADVSLRRPRHSPFQGRPCARATSRPATATGSVACACRIRVRWPSKFLAAVAAVEQQRFVDVLDLPVEVRDDDARGALLDHQREPAHLLLGLALLGDVLWEVGAFADACGQAVPRGCSRAS